MGTKLSYEKCSYSGDFSTNESIDSTTMVHEIIQINYYAMDQDGIVAIVPCAEITKITVVHL